MIISKYDVIDKLENSCKVTLESILTEEEQKIIPYILKAIRAEKCYITLNITKILPEYTNYEIHQLETKLLKAGYSVKYFMWKLIISFERIDSNAFRAESSKLIFMHTVGALLFFIFFRYTASNSDLILSLSMLCCITYLLAYVFVPLKDYIYLTMCFMNYVRYINLGSK